MAIFVTDISDTARDVSIIGVVGYCGYSGQRYPHTKHPIYSQLYSNYTRRRKYPGVPIPRPKSLYIVHMATLAYSRQFRLGAGTGAL